MSEKDKKIIRGLQPFSEDLNKYDEVYLKRVENMKKARKVLNEMRANGELKRKPKKKKAPKPSAKKAKLFEVIKEIAGLAPTERIRGTIDVEDLKQMARFLCEQPMSTLTKMERDDRMPFYGVLFIRAIKKDAVMGNLKNFQWIFANILKDNESTNTGEVIFQSSFIQAEDIEFTDTEDTKDE